MAALTYAGNRYHTALPSLVICQRLHQPYEFLLISGTGYNTGENRRNKALSDEHHRRDRANRSGWLRWHTSAPRRHAYDLPPAKIGGRKRGRKSMPESSAPPGRDQCWFYESLEKGTNPQHKPEIHKRDEPVNWLCLENRSSRDTLYADGQPS